MSLDTADHAGPLSQVPVTILTGFLGRGKPAYSTTSSRAGMASGRLKLLPDQNTWLEFGETVASGHWQNNVGGSADMSAELKLDARYRATAWSAVAMAGSLT